MTQSSPASPPPRPAGWREWIGLPDLRVDWIKAKLDTGARSSALHAFEIEEFGRDGIGFVRFSIHPYQRSESPIGPCEARILDRREIKSSNGTTELRHVVETNLEMFEGELWPIELTLASRDEMGFRMLIGRQALKNRVLVDSGRSYLSGRPPREIRRANRGLPA